MTEDEMAGWHHWLDGRESRWTPGVGDGQGGLACCDSWGHKELDKTERLHWTEIWGSMKESLAESRGRLWMAHLWLRVVSDTANGGSPLAAPPVQDAHLVPEPSHPADKRKAWWGSGEKEGTTSLNVVCPVLYMCCFTRLWHNSDRNWMTARGDQYPI